MPVSSNRQSSIPSATPEATAKFVPVSGDRRAQRELASGQRAGGRRLGTLTTRLRSQPPDDVADGFDLPVAAADQVGDHAGPAGLVERADRGAVVAVEVFAEDQVVVPGGIGLQ